MTTAAPLNSSRGPVDRRLWQLSAASRRHILASVALTTVSAVSIVAGAVCIGTILGGVITNEGRADWHLVLGVLVLSIVIDAGCTWVRDSFGHRAADRIVTDLELDVLEAATARPIRTDDVTHDAFVLVTRKLADLRVYLAEYVPALGAALTIPPIVLVVIAWFDLTSAVIIAITIPFVPTFMILIGLLSRDRATATLKRLTRQSAEMLDVLEGLPTLRALGRERGLDAHLRRTGDRYRRTALAGLRIAFLSSFVLEFIATLSVALVAVSIGLRLVFGEMPLTAGIIALVLAPHVYGPIRTVGAKFHAAEDGVAALYRALDFIDDPPTVPSGAATPTGTSIVLDDLTVASTPRNLSATFRPGSITALIGPNGCGKSTTLHAILGLAEYRGTITVDGTNLSAISTSEWWTHIAWLPQHPALVPGTLRENLALSGADVGDVVEQASAATGFDEVLATLPEGWRTRIGVRGEGLSRGQQQRLALTRTLASPRRILLLDEPTAHLDTESERRVIAALRERADRGATVIVVAHRPVLIAAADQIVDVHGH